MPPMGNESQGKTAARGGPDVIRSRIFDGLNDAERRTCIDRAMTLDIRAGRHIVRQGDEAHTFYLVRTGLLKLVQITPEGAGLIVRFVGPAEPFGGVVALNGPAYPVSALAVEVTQLLAWPRDELNRLLQQFPPVRTNIMREMAMHMSDALTRVRELTTERVGQRLAHTLLRLIRQCGRETPEGILITHPLTRQELAELAGTTLYTVSRTLSQWEAAGVLKSLRRQLLVRDPKRLDLLARTAE